MTRPQLAIVDDEQEICNFIGRVAGECGFEVFATTSSSAFLDRVKEIDFNVVILDLNMPGVDGIELLRELAALRSKAQILVASGVDSKVMDSAVRVGQERCLDMAGFIHKPIRLQELRQLLRGLAPKSDAVKPVLAATEMTREDLALAIDRNEMVLHYQPQMDLASSRIVGVEALIRWQHPSLGLLPPMTFLPLAESTGLIIPMTDWLYKAAIGQAGDWRKQGLELRVALNLSARLPFDYDMPEQLAVVCKHNQFEPDHVTLELTETAAMDDPVRLIDVFTRLRMKGFHLSIDDFGTAYSSLVQLQRLPFTEMKIDKSFVMTMSHSAASRIIVETIIGMASNMNMKSVAEGVESEALLSALRAKRCDLAQGYLISRPVPSEQIPGICRATTSRMLGIFGEAPQIAGGERNFRSHNEATPP
jgi:EAL domain-containing protein (putative c-di-GMP-specific phosphodiesterase class I)/ActR/RegA family two-component response regulator